MLLHGRGHHASTTISICVFDSSHLVWCWKQRCPLCRMLAEAARRPMEDRPTLHGLQSRQQRHRRSVRCVTPRWPPNFHVLHGARGHQRRGPLPGREALVQPRRHAQRVRRRGHAVARGLQLRGRRLRRHHRRPAGHRRGRYALQLQLAGVRPELHRRGDHVLDRRPSASAAPASRRVREHPKGGEPTGCVGFIHGGVPEVCNGIDDDCNGQIDDGLTNEGPCTLPPGHKWTEFPRRRPDEPGHHRRRRHAHDHRRAVRGRGPARVHRYQLQRPLLHRRRRHMQPERARSRGVQRSRRTQLQRADRRARLQVEPVRVSLLLAPRITSPTVRRRVRALELRRLHAGAVARGHSG